MACPSSEVVDIATRQSSTDSESPPESIGNLAPSDKHTTAVTISGASPPPPHPNSYNFSKSTPRTAFRTAFPSAGLVYKVLPKVAAFVLFMMLHDYLQEQLELQFEGRDLRLPSIFTLSSIFEVLLTP